MIDLRSDTLTKPCANMLSAVCSAEMGDDCYGEDKSVRDLEIYCAELFGKDAAVLLPSGTMSNQIGLRALTRPGDELVCEASYHINFFEASPTVDLAKVSVNAITTQDGILRVDDIERALLERARWQRQYYRPPSLIWLENTINGHGGRIYPINELRQVKDWSDKKGIPLFMDGARILNASAATGITPKEYGTCTTMLTLCFAKGLSAPMGAVLMGDERTIQEARRFRKWYGGGLHQSGIFAGAASYAIKNNVPQLRTDNQNARAFYNIIKSSSFIEPTKPDTNIVIFDIQKAGCDPKYFVERMAFVGVRLLSWRGSQIRCVFSNLVNRRDAEAAGRAVIDELDNLKNPSSSNVPPGLAA